MRITWMHLFSNWHVLDSGIEAPAHSLRFDEHTTLLLSELEPLKSGLNETYQAATKEHDRNRDMFEILSSPFTTPCREMFHPDIANAVQPNDEGLDEFSRGQPGFPLALFAAGRLIVPSPSYVCEATHPPSKCQQSIPEEYPSLDEVCHAIENVIAPLSLVS